MLELGKDLGQFFCNFSISPGNSLDTSPYTDATKLCEHRLPGLIEKLLFF
jgi:hypothetical protein